MLRDFWSIKAFALYRLVGPQNKLHLHWTGLDWIGFHQIGISHGDIAGKRLAVSDHKFHWFSTSFHRQFPSSWEHLLLVWPSFYTTWDNRLVEQVQNPEQDKHTCCTRKMYHSIAAISFLCQLASHGGLLSCIQIYGHEKRATTAILESSCIPAGLLFHSGGFCFLLGPQDFTYKMAVQACSQCSSWIRNTIWFDIWVCTSCWDLVPWFCYNYWTCHYWASPIHAMAVDEFASVGNSRGTLWLWFSLELFKTIPRVWRSWFPWLSSSTALHKIWELLIDFHLHGLVIWDW